jgi:hypothetical protein
MRRDMTFTYNDKKIIFDDYVDNTVEYNSYWVGMCKHCYDKHKGILGNRVDDCGSGLCSVKGCNNEADYYVDFDMNEVEFVADDFFKDLLMEQQEQM